MNLNTLLLILRPQEHFGIVGAELRSVSSYGRFMTPLSRVKSDTIAGDADNDGLRNLAELCERLLPGSLYARYANKKVFRRTEDFWSTADNTVKDYVKRMADQLLLKVTEQATALDIPMLYVPTASAPLHIDERLLPATDTVAMPLMHFVRHDEGITYRLTLRLNDEQQAIVPVMLKRFAVLCYSPALFIIDNTLCRLPEGFSGKLLLPFIKKEVVEIPQRIERDYMNRFIIRHVARAEITAEGFDIADEPLSPTPQLNTERSIDGYCQLRLSFRYGNNDYAPDSKRRGRVTLIEESNGFRFVRQLRDVRMEEHYMEVLRHLPLLQLSRQGIIRFESLRQMLDWLSSYAPQLHQQGFCVVQPSKEVYYIGPMSVEQSDEWQGDWLQTRVTVVLDDGRLRIPFSDLRDAILQGEQEYMLPTGERLLIPEEWMQRYGDILLVGQRKGDMFIRHRRQIVAQHTATEALPRVVPPLGWRGGGSIHPARHSAPLPAYRLRMAVA